MQAYIVRRLLWAIPPILGALTLVFILMAMIPGDPALVILGSEGTPDPAAVEAMQRKLGLDRPFYVQYFSWMGDFLRGDLGTGIWSNIPVSEELAVRLPVTLYMVGMALVFGTVLAIPIGVLSALKQDTWVDYALRVFAVFGISIPSFVVAILVVFFLVIVFNWFAPLEYANVFTDPWLSTQQLLLPALVLGYRYTAVIGRMLRSTLLEVLREDYIRTARAKGLATPGVVRRHAMKNAFLPVITVIGIESVFLLSGSVIIEAIFHVPGMGNYLLDAIFNLDYITIQGVVAVIVTGTVVVNLLVDLFYGWLDPRIRYQ